MKRLLVSFSGGRTSGYMTKRVLDTWRDDYDEIVVLFANTGQEHEKTLEFVHNCDVEFGFNTVWLEAVVNPDKGKGTRHKVVSYESASRTGVPFEMVISKYGITNADMPHCTRELKLMPMESYLKSIGWGHHDRCVGIRVDEIDRMSVNAEKARIKYPLVTWGVTKTMVLDWWAAQDFDLGLADYHGNCVWCWKKSDRKLYTIANENPEYFDFPLRMEEKYGDRGAMHENTGTNQVFFRKFRSTKEIIASSKKPFIRWEPTTKQRQIGLFSLDEMDYPNGCSESCEVEFV
jgi:hypothetical protein